MRRFILAAALFPLAAAGAQVTAPADTAIRASGPSRPATDSLFRRARRLVAEGNGVAGRALVDSLMHAADPTSPAYGDALYWHGALASTAAEAERDYRRVIVEYPLAYYADDALLAIAELEQARGDRAGALMHLQRYVKEHPGGNGRGIAALAAARLAFEQRDSKVGCSMISIARTSVAAADVEQRNQIDYYGRQCTGDMTTASAPAAASTPATAPVVSPAASSAAAPVPAKPSSSPIPVTRAAPASAPARTSSSTTASTPVPVSTMPEPVTPPRRPASNAPPSRAVVRSAAGPAPKPVPTSRAPGSAAGRRMYTIQVAAYDTRPPAEALVTKLAGRGVKARVSGTAKPFRVRLAFYRTRQEATTEVAALKARGIVGFVTEEAPPGAQSP